MNNDHEIKLSGFADNANFIVSNVTSLKLTFNACSGFQTFSSLKLNLEKSDAYWIAEAWASTNAPINCKWVNLNSGAIRSLGIFNSSDIDLAEKLNFLDNLKCLIDILNLWCGRDLSLEGKILAFKSLALSKLLYSCTMKFPSKQLIEPLNIIHKNFIWNNKRPKINSLHLLLIILRVVTTIATQCKTFLNKSFLGNKTNGWQLSSWKIIPSKISSVFGGTNIFHPNTLLSLSCRKNVDKIPDNNRIIITLFPVQNSE